MGLLSFLGFGRPKRKRRRRSTRHVSDAQQARREKAALDRKAAAWVRQDDARKERERARAERQRVRLETRLMRGANRAERSHQREHKQLKQQGFSDAEIDQVRSYHYEDNPRFKLALDFLQGRGEHARRNPSCETCRQNPSVGEAAAQFHGHSGSGFTSGHKVVLGELTRINYRPPRGSERGGSEWTHEAGDRGLPFFKNRGRGRVLGDPNTGAVTIETRGSGMKFDSHRGLVG